VVPPDALNPDGTEAKSSSDAAGLRGIDKARYVWRGGVAVVLRGLNVMLPAVPTAGVCVCVCVCVRVCACVYVCVCVCV
jgi:hypothetical protein